MSWVARMLLGLVLLVLTSTAQAATYYAGAVENCGGGGQDPCGSVSGDATLGNPKDLKSLVGTVTAGHTIVLLCGTYYDSTNTNPALGLPVYDFTNSGTSGSSITIQSKIPLCAKIQALDNHPIGRAWYVEDNNYLTFDGLYIYGQLKLVHCTGCIVKNSEITGGNWDGSSIISGMVLYDCDNCTIHDNYCHALTPRTYLPATSELAGSRNNSCIMLFANSTGTVIEHNYIEGEGPSYKDAGNANVKGAVSWSGIGEKGGGMVGNTYRRNIIVGTNYCFQGMGSTSGLVRSGQQLIYENICANTVMGGVQFDHQTYEYQIYNNTFYNLAISYGSYSSSLSWGGATFGSFDSAAVSSSGDNRDHVFYNNIWHTIPYIYRKEPSFNPTYSSCRITNLLAPFPTLTASASGGSLATGTYWVRIATDNSGTITGTGPSRSVNVTGPTGSITVDFDRTAGSPTNYRIYYGTTDYSQNTYITVAATGSAGSAQTATITGSGGTTLPYTKSNVNQWQWPANLASSDYNDYYNLSVGFERYGSGGSTHAANLAQWQSYSKTIGNAGTCLAGYDIHSLSVDPQFVNEATRDFRLKPTSPLRGAGQGGVHMGAYPTDSNLEPGPRNGQWPFAKPK